MADSGAVTRMENSPSVVVVLPAAGSGTRMQIPTAKQFCYVHNRPVISYSIQAFERVPIVQHIIVVTSVEGEEEMKDILATFQHNPSRVSIARGGDTRFRSIWKGIQTIEKVSLKLPDVVILHDGVRPFVPEDIIVKVTEAAQQHGASGAVHPCISTVIRPDKDGCLEESLHRSHYRNSEMPQAFQYGVIKQAFEKCTDFEFEHGTECLNLALLHCNVRAKLIDGPDCLWKVTHSKDLITAGGYIKAQGCDVSVVGNINPFCQQIMDSLKQEKITVTTEADCSICILELNCAKPTLAGNLSVPAQGVIVYVCVGDSQVSLETKECIEQEVQKSAREQKNCVFGLLISKEDPANLPQITNILASLIKDRQSCFSGQTFKV